MADNNEIYELTHTVENSEDNFEFDATEAASDLVVSPATFNLSHEQSNNTDEFAFSDGEDVEVEPMNLAPATFNMTHTRTGDTDSFDFDDEGGSTPTGDLSGGTVDFVEAATRTNIESGSTLSTLFSKIKKWFADLKTVAFTGNYSDLINKPTIPSVGDATITITQGGVTKGSFGVNDTQNKTITLDAGGGSEAPEVTGSATVDANTGTPGVEVTTTGSGTQVDPYVLAFAFTNLKGGTGDTGQPGKDGINGSDGVSPEVTVTAITGGNRVTITDADHPLGQSFDIMDGEDGTNGSDGISPTVTVRAITGGHQIEIVSAGGTERFDVMDGKDGSQGDTGPAGPGVPPAGTAGQILSKVNGTDYNTQWINAPFAGLHIYRWHASGAAYAGSGAFTDIQTDFVLPQGQVIIGCAPKYAGLPQLCVTNFWNNAFNETFYTVWNFGASDDIQWTVAEGIVITADTV